MMDLSVILVSYNVKEFLVNCIQSILQHTSEIDYEIVVVDNVSSDGSVETVRESFPQVKLIANTKNVGLAAATAQGIQASTGQYVLYLNPDTGMSEGALNGMVRFANSHPEVSAFTCRLLTADGSLQHSCFRFPNLRMAFYGFFPLVPMDSTANGRYPVEVFNIKFEPEHVLGAFLMVRRHIIEELDGWDSRFFMYFEETDFCYRLKRAGYTTLYTPDFSIVHYGGRSTSQYQEQMSLEFYRSQAFFYRKNYTLGHLLALKVIVLLGVWFWATRSCIGFLRGRIGGTLLCTRLRNYLRILLVWPPSSLAPAIPLDGIG